MSTGYITQHIGHGPNQAGQFGPVAFEPNNGVEVLTFSTSAVGAQLASDTNIVSIRGITACHFKLGHVSADYITNGGFDADASWTKGTGWTIAAGVASSDGTQGADADLTQVGATLLTALVQNQVYEVTFTVSGYSAGNVTPVVGDTEGTDRGADGTFTENIIAGAGADVDIRADLNFIGDIDDVVVKLLPTATVLDHYLDAKELAWRAIEIPPDGRDLRVSMIDAA